MSSPSIVFIQKYHSYYSDNFKNTNLYKSNPKKYDLYMKTSSFYRCKESFDVAKYLNRENACDKTQLDTALQKEKAQRDISTYMGNRKGSTGLFNEFGDISEEDIKNIKKELNSIKTNVYECVFSFTPEFSKVNVNSKLQAYNLLNKVLPKYFKSKDMNPKNVGWFAAYHTNTDNRHIHLIFYEKTPTKINSRNVAINIDFNENDFINMKTMIEMETQPVVHEYEQKRDPVLSEAQSYIMNNPDDKEIKKLKEVLSKSETRQFNRLDNKSKETVVNFVSKLNEYCPQFKQALDEYHNALEKTQKCIYDIYAENNIDPKKIPPKVRDFYKSRCEDLNNRLYNKIFKTCKTFLPMTKEEKPKSFYAQLKFNKEKVSTKADIKREEKKTFSSDVNGYNKSIDHSLHSTKNLKKKKTSKNFTYSSSYNFKSKTKNDMDNYSSNILKPIIRKNLKETTSIFQSILNLLDKESASFSSISSTDVSASLWNEANRKEIEEKKKKKKQQEEDLSL